MSVASALCRRETPLDELAGRLDEEGYVIVEDLAPEVTTCAREELTPHIEAAPFGHVTFLGFRTKRLGGLLAKSAAVRELALHPTILALADRLLLPHCARYRLNFSGIMHLAPGAEAQPLHRDGAVYPLMHPHPPTIMPTMWALTDFSAENGATRIIPGSHRWEQDRMPHEDEMVAAEMPAGSVLIYTCGALHGGGDNRSGGVRTGLALQYALGWLRQEENQYIVNPPEIAREYPERLRRLIGYDYGGPYLGFAHCDDPHRVLEDSREGPPRRSTPEVNRAAERIEWLRLGEVEPEPTPVRSGQPAGTLVTPPEG